MNPSDSTAINTFLVSGGVTAAVYLIVAQVRPFIEGPLPPTARLHDPVIRLLALGLGIIIEVVAHGLIAPLSSQRVFLDVGLGAAAGLAAMGIHALGKPTPDAVMQLDPATFVQGAALLPSRVIVEHVVPQSPPPPPPADAPVVTPPRDPAPAVPASTSASRMAWSVTTPSGQTSVPLPMVGGSPSVLSPTPMTPQPNTTVVTTTSTVAPQAVAPVDSLPAPHTGP